MNDLGLTLAWLAVQVTLVLVPALALYATAARRGPDRAAWVAALSLALVVALNVAAFLPGIGRGYRRGEVCNAEASRPVEVATLAESPIADGRDAPRHPTSGPGLFAGWRVAWARLERGAAEPAERCRPWGTMLASLALAGSAAGLIRLALGLGAIFVCRRRGKTVDDPTLIGRLDELCVTMGCRAPVELREVPDLVGPATAGWRRPVILLPEDWRSWDDSERRAVLAHELAHVVRGDYAAGLIARLAVALNYYHPLVRWMAGRLRLKQELAADAIGARHAGGRGGYLVALSRLALRQDGRSPCWPARAFLPARGTLTRRIAMLRDETRIGTLTRPWTRAGRLAIAVSLLGVTAAVGMLRGPARAGDDGAPAANEPRAGAPATRTDDTFPPPLYFGEGMQGAVVLRPAAAARHAGLKRLEPFLKLALDGELSHLAKELGVDMTRPGFVKLRAEDLECITLGLGFGQTSRTKDDKGNPLHTVKFGSPTFRTVAPFDWLAFLRQWRLECAEVKEGRRAYYRITGPLAAELGPGPSAVYLPDDRTLILDEEKVIRKLVRGETPPLPAFVRGPDWQRACRGLMAVAISNQDDAFAKVFDLGRPDEAAILPLFQGVDHWTFSVDDADAIVLRAAAACAGGDSGAALARSIDSLVKLGRTALDQTAPQVRPGEVHDRTLHMTRALLTNLRVEHTGRSVGVSTDRFGTLADVAAIVEDEARCEEKSASRKDSTKGARL
jgi:beta-lactamase regulating signal transducer with metallopeptidase domain